MGKARISISLDEKLAERIKAHAERAGMDVSGYLANAALHQMVQAEAIEAQFGPVDEMIRAAEADAARLPAPPEVTDEELTEDERRAVQAAMELVYGDDHTGEN